jgi:hypothetical protein
MVESGRDSDAAAANADGRPNIVVVMSDDQDLASMRVMGNVQSLLERQGTTFNKSFASYSLCCPSSVDESQRCARFSYSSTVES